MKIIVVVMNHNMVMLWQRWKLNPGMYSDKTRIYVLIKKYSITQEKLDLFCFGPQSFYDPPLTSCIVIKQKLNYVNNKHMCLGA